MSQFEGCRPWIETQRTRTNLDGLVGVSDESDEEAEHHVDEKGDEGVEVESAEEPHHVAVVSHLQEGGVHVVPVDEGEEALRHLVEGSELEEKRFDDEVKVKGDLLGHADTWNRMIIIFRTLSWWGPRTIQPQKQ